MKKIALLISPLVSLATPSVIFAQDITINRPRLGNQNVGYDSIGTFIGNALNLAFIIAVIAVLFMMVWGAIEWIFSGGNKDNVKTARERIIHALVGLAILAVAFAIFQLAGKFLGFTTTSFNIPTPSNP